MGATLHAVAGPLKGQVFPLDDLPMGIGRDTVNRIAIGDISVSRRHSSLREEPEGMFRVADLESLNGTFVNGVPVGDRALADGDRLQIGSSLFVFLLNAGEDLSPPAGGTSGPQAGTITATRTSAVAVLRLDEALFLAPDRRAAAASAAEIARGLDFLLRATRALHSAHGLAEWHERLLGLTLEAAPVARVAVALTDEACQLGDVVARERGGQRSSAVEIDAAVARRAIESRAAILCDEIRDAGPPRVASVTAPLVAATEPKGVLHAEADGGFDLAHTHLLAALASIAAGALENVRHVEWLEGERQRLESDVKVEHEMVGESPALRHVLEFVGKVAQSDATVLLLGESGTGKELLARAIHANSRRSARPFVVVNCAALTETLLESELFGHERGAFTGAVARKPGRIEVADGGTLFLDEVGELAAGLQAKVLRFLETREFERVGGTQPLRVDVRILAATNLDLAEAVRQGSFRADLYFRLNVVSVTTPPLRARREDIPLLASYFAAGSARRANRTLVGISPEARALLVRYDWPGNVRELHNAIERAVLLGDGELVRPEDLPESLVESGATGAVVPGRYHEAVAEAKRRLIQGAVAESRGNVSEAARQLGLHPNYLHRLMRNLGLKEGEKR